MDTLREHLRKAGKARWANKTLEEKREHAKMMNEKKKLKNASTASPGGLIAP